MTGGGRSNGAAICQAFADQGAAIAIAYIDLSGVDSVALGINRAGGTAAAFEVDVAQPSAIANMIDGVAHRLGLVQFAAVKRLSSGRNRINRVSLLTTSSLAIRVCGNDFATFFRSLIRYR